MKRTCKNVDISDRKLIEKAVWDCLNGKMSRKDTIGLLSEYSGLSKKLIAGLSKELGYHAYDGIVNAVIDGIREEILSKKYIVKKIKYKKKKDNSSGKIRNIGIQDIKQQIYDYIAVYGLRELFEKKIGYYQCGAVKGKGNDFGASAIYEWLKDRRNRWAWQADIKHYYESVDKNILKRMLIRDVKNQSLLELVFFLIDTFESGLSIGSYLSQFLANYYLSKAYVFASQLTKTRNKKNGDKCEIRLVSHVLFQMDDILFVGHDKRNLKIAAKKFEKYIEDELHLHLKEDPKIIDLESGYIDILGRRISRKSLTIRSSTFLRTRRIFKKAYKCYAKAEKIPFDTAKSCVSRYGVVKHTNSRKFERKYHVKELQSVSRGIVGFCSRNGR